MKYMIMMFGDQAGMQASRSVEWIKEMIEFMHRLNADLIASGERLASRRAGSL